MFNKKLRKEVESLRNEIASIRREMRDRTSIGLYGDSTILVDSGLYNPLYQHIKHTQIKDVIGLIVDRMGLEIKLSTEKLALVTKRNKK